MTCATEDINDLLDPTSGAAAAAWGSTPRKTATSLQIREEHGCISVSGLKEVQSNRHYAMPSCNSTCGLTVPCVVPHTHARRSLWTL